MFFVLLSCLWLQNLAFAQTCPPTPGAINTDGLEPKMLIGIGAQKCGSGYIFKAMKTHPQIWPANRKELHVFDQRDFEPTQEKYENYLEQWGSLSELNGTNKVLMEFTPAYLHNPKAPCHIRHLFPNAKFIVTLRDPVYRSLSFMNMARNRCYQMKEGQGECSKHFMNKVMLVAGMDSRKAMTCKEWFSDILPQFRDSENILHTNTQCVDAFLEDPWVGCPYDQIFAVGKSLYAPQISRWLKVFNASQFLFINAHELFLDPETHWKKICNFAGLDENWSPESPGKHANEILFVDDQMDEVTDTLERILKKPHEDLYRLFNEHGIKFSPLAREPYGENRSSVLVSDILSFCAPNVTGDSYASPAALIGLNKSFKRLDYSRLIIGMLLITLVGLPLMIRVRSNRWCR